MTAVRLRLPRAPRLTIRARLTLTYATLVAVSGAGLIALLWAFMRFVPTYAIVAAPVPRLSGDGSGSDPGSGADSGVGSGAGDSAPQAWTGHTLPPNTGPEAFAVRSAGDFLDLMLLAAIGALVLLVAVSALAGWLIAGRVLRPLQLIHGAAELAASGTLSHRIKRVGPDDEIKHLADAFDDMLEDLERAFAAQQRFAANASHELKTPLTVTHTMIEVALANPRTTAADLRALVTRLQVINRDNARIVESLLSLSDVGQHRFTVDAVDVHPLVTDELRRLAPEAEAAGVTVVLAEPPAEADADTPPAGTVISANPVLARQAISNLLRNAVQHNVPEGRVTVTLQHRGVRIENTGAPVNPELLASYTEPFVRGAGRVNAHHSDADGSGRHHGLGLALAAAIIDAHGGALELAARPGGGLIVSAEFPPHD